MADFAPQMLPPITGQSMGGMMPFISPDQIAQNQTDMLQWQQKQALAQQLMQAQYQPNTGKTGVGATILERVMGALAQNQQNAKLSDILKQQFQIENQASQAKKQQEIEDEYRKMQIAIQQATGIAKGEGQVKNELNPIEAIGGGKFILDHRTNQLSINPDYNASEIDLEKAKAQIAAANRQGPADPYAGIKQALASGVITQDEATKRMHDVALGISNNGGSASDWQVIGSNRVNKVTGEVQPLKDASGKLIPAGTDAKSNAVVEKSQEGLADNVLQYVATATHTDVDKLRSMTPDQVQALYKQKGGRDWGTAIASAIPGIGQYIVSKANPNLDAFATGAQANEARIQHPVGTIPYNAEVLARKSSIGPEKTDTFNAAFIKKALEDAQDTKPQLPVSPSDATPTQTAINPKTGQRIGLVNGQWVPI